jgi:signal transduction histidine kinase
MGRSLRARLILGAVFWTVGLFGILVVLHNEIMRRNPWLPPRLTASTLSHTPHLTAISIVCLMIGARQIRRGVTGVQRQRRAVTSLRRGDKRRLDGAYPSEVQPLVDDLNTLLDHREQAVGRALGRAGDLAHGLKTPLALLTREAERARAAGLHDLAATLSEEIDRMRRQVDYHLARARAAASGATPGAHCLVADAAEAVRRALDRLYADRALTIAITAPADLGFRGQREDLEEILGNVLDNACHWASTRVALTATTEQSRLRITVDDDGSGLDASLRERVLTRGVRADEASPGTGLGLAIVRDLVELYGGSISLDRSPLGGLRVELTLPAATTE